MRKTLFSLAILAAVPYMHASNELSVVEKVANHILKNQNHQLEITEDGTCKISSYYQEWRYVNGVLDLSMMDLYRITGNGKYRDFVKDNLAFFFNKSNQDLMRKDYEKGIKNTGYYRFFSMKSLDDCGAMGAALVELNKFYPNEEYTSYLKKIADYILHKEKRLPDGTLCRGNKDNLTVWLDDLYMSLSFLTHYGTAYQNMKCFDCAAQQVIQFDSLLSDKTSGLYYHCYYHKMHEQGVAHWGRANGWGLYAQTLLLSTIPENHPLRGRLMQIFRRAVRSISRFQDKDGMWHQLLDKEDSYQETSCTAMFAYSIARGINEGWLEQEYVPVVKRAWNGITSSYITEEGELRNVCIGTGISYDLPFYYERPTPLNDAHGLGAFIQAGLEVYKLLEKQRG